MSWNERLRKLKYMSPSGRLFLLDFEELERSGGKKAPDSEAPGQNGGPIQDMGQIKDTHSFTVYIHGKDYDQDADRFKEALSESGAAGIEHPRWGNIKGLVTTWRQTERFVQGAGMATFTFTFIEASEWQFRFPSASTDVSAVAELAANKSESAALDSLTKIVEKPSISSVAVLHNFIRNTSRKAVDSIGQLTSPFKEAHQKLNESKRLLDDALARTTDETVGVTKIMFDIFRLPADLKVSASRRLDAMKNLYMTISQEALSVEKSYGDWFGRNVTTTLVALASASAELTTKGDIVNRVDAVEIIENLRSILSSVREDVEAVEELHQSITSEESLAAMEQVFAVAIEGILRKIINLPAVRKMVLDREVTPIELCYEINGGIECLDKFIENNALKGNEILMIPRGREVLWYA